MTKGTVACTELAESWEAGRDLAQQIMAQVGAAPDVIFLFATQSYQYEALLSALKSECHPRFLLGCAAYSTYTRTAVGTSFACAAALRSDDFLFSLTVGRNIDLDPREAARQVIEGFQGWEHPEYRFRTAILFMDVINVFMDDFVKALTHSTHGNYQFFGCGAAENGQQKYAPVFAGEQALGNSVVALEVLSHKPLGIGSRHAWIPATPSMQAITENGGTLLKSLDGRPALEVFREYAQLNELDFPEHSLLPFFLHNMLGVETGKGYQRLRLPLMLNDEGVLTSSSPIPSYAKVCIMKSTFASVLRTVEITARSALNNLYGSRPALALYVDCRASSLRLAGDYSELLRVVCNRLPHTPFAGCNIYGQIVRSQGQYSGFHNCTPSICLFPE
ncbi:FIST signal transduction protein [Ktedonosporobacter rubrisoli]|nr:FIST N-terminal domain-containing protein [Ktedonosporobacter rubrisoli]